MGENISIEEQVKIALDGRTQRWLSLQVGIAESDLSKKIKGQLPFTKIELSKINRRLKSKINAKNTLL